MQPNQARGLRCLVSWGRTAGEHRPFSSTLGMVVRGTLESSSQFRLRQYTSRGRVHGESPVLLGLSAGTMLSL